MTTTATISPGDIRTVLDERSRFYGTSVTVRSIRGAIAYCQTGGDIYPFLLSELGVDVKRKACQRGYQKSTAIEAMQARLDAKVARVELLEQRAKAVAIADSRESLLVAIAQLREVL